MMATPTILPSGQLHPDLVNNAAFVKYVSVNASVSTGETHTKASVAVQTASVAVKKDAFTSKEAVSTDTGIYKPGINLVEQMKSDMESMKMRFLQMAAEALNQQGKQAVAADDSLWSLLSQGSFTVSSEIQAKAQAAIATDGFWGVSQTAMRIVSFGQALTNRNAAMIETLKEAFIAGYQAAQDIWGGALPDIAGDTYDEVMRLFDEWAADGSGRRTDAGGGRTEIDVSVEKTYHKMQEITLENNGSQNTAARLPSQEDMIERAKAKLKATISQSEINANPEAQAAKSEKMLAQLDRLDLFESVSKPLNLEGVIIDARNVECLAGSVTVTIDVDALNQMESHRPGGHRPPHDHHGPGHGRGPDGPHRNHHGPDFDRRLDDHRRDHHGPDFGRRPEGPRHDHHGPEHGWRPDSPHHGRPPMRPDRPERPESGGNGEGKETITITFHQFGTKEYGTLNVGGEEMGLSHDGKIWAEMPDNTVRALVVDQDALARLFESGAAKITSITPSYRIQ